MAALLLAGCSESSVGALSVSKEGFVTQADFICNEADNQQPVEREAFEAKYEKDLENLALVPHEATMGKDLILPSVKGQIRKLEDLEIPESEREGFEAILARWKEAVRKGERDPYSIANFWVPAQDPLAPVNKLATRYGFEVCSELR